MQSHNKLSYDVSFFLNKGLSLLKGGMFVFFLSLVSFSVGVSDGWAIETSSKKNKRRTQTQKLNQENDRKVAAYKKQYIEKFQEIEALKKDIRDVYQQIPPGVLKKPLNFFLENTFPKNPLEGKKFPNKVGKGIPSVQKNRAAKEKEKFLDKITSELPGQFDRAHQGLTLRWMELKAHQKQQREEAAKKQTQQREEADKKQKQQREEALKREIASLKQELANQSKAFMKHFQEVNSEIDKVYQEFVKVFKSFSHLTYEKQRKLALSYSDIRNPSLENFRPPSEAPKINSNTPLEKQKDTYQRVIAAYKKGIHDMDAQAESILTRLKRDIATLEKEKTSQTKQIAELEVLKKKKADLIKGYPAHYEEQKRRLNAPYQEFLKAYKAVTLSEERAKKLGIRHSDTHPPRLIDRASYFDDRPDDPSKSPEERRRILKKVIGSIKEQSYQSTTEGATSRINSLKKETEILKKELTLQQASKASRGNSQGGPQDTWGMSASDLSKEKDQLLKEVKDRETSFFGYLDFVNAKLKRQYHLVKSIYDMFHQLGIEEADNYEIGHYKMDHYLVSKERFTKQIKKYEVGPNTPPDKAVRNLRKKREMLHSWQLHEQEKLGKHEGQVLDDIFEHFESVTHWHPKLKGKPGRNLRDKILDLEELYDSDIKKMKRPSSMP